MSTNGAGEPRLSKGRVRQLSAAELGIEVSAGGPSPTSVEDERLDDLGIGDDDHLLLKTIELLEHYGGVIFSGPPGTSKSWYAENIALKLTKGNPDLVRFLQFHPSYQYEDFVEGYVPTGEGFELLPKHLLEVCALAENQPPGEWVVLVIDELSRGDPGRIFGEALTYVEKSKRGFEFHVASGNKVSIPPNLVFLATMNPLDRGVDEVDAAFERRFAKIAMDPDETILTSFLNDAGMDAGLQSRVLAFFRTANGRAKTNPYAAIGQTFFLNVSDEAGLRRVWDHQLRFLFDKAYQLDPEGLADVRRSWARIATGATVDAATSEGAGEEQTTP